MTVEWWEEPVAATPDEVRRRHEENRVSWEQVAAVYGRENQERIADLRDGRSNLHPIEREMLWTHVGPLGEWCDLAIHLQCASGRDTLSLWLEGARRVVGVDISETHVENARLTTEALDAPAEWYACDVLDTPQELDGTADLVYTGRGAIGWIHDLRAWAEVIARLLKPGGVLSLFDDHPASFLFDNATETISYSGARYFGGAFAGRGWSESYVTRDLPEEELAVNHDRIWTFADQFAALRSAGLELVHLGEHPEPYWDSFPKLDEEQVARLPQTFSLLARKPKA